MTDSTEAKHYRLSIRRPVTMAMVFLTLLVFGGKSYQELAINLMPDIAYPTLTVRTEYEGAAPEDVENLVTRKLEERLSVVSGVVQVSIAPWEISPHIWSIFGNTAARYMGISRRKGRNHMSKRLISKISPR